MRSAAFFEDDARRKSAGGRRPSNRPVLPDFDDPADGSGARRRAPAAEVESPSARSSNWFLHDDRDLQAGDNSRGSGDRRGRGPRVQPPTGPSRHRGPAEWEYVDPKGVVQGPFSSKDMLKWADAGFFTSDQQIRRAGETKFSILRACMHQLQQDVRGPSGDAPMQRGGRGAQEEYRKPRPARSLEQAPDGSYKGHPADALLSPDQVSSRRNEIEPPPRGGPEYSRRGGPGGRGPGRDREQGLGRRGGRGGGYGDGGMRPERGDRRQGAAAAQAAAEPEGPKLPHSIKVAQRLFTGEATLATEEPVWRYVDPQAQTQGPFPARTMLEWYRRGLLNDMSLQTCGAERKMAPPDFPQPEHYRPLGILMQGIKRGQRFHPLTVEDVRAGQGSGAQYNPFGRRDAKPAAPRSQDPQAEGSESLPKRQAGRGRGRMQGSNKEAAAGEDDQLVSLQLSHGATEADGIKVALSMGKPAAAAATAKAAPERAGGAPETPREANGTAEVKGVERDTEPSKLGVAGEQLTTTDEPKLAPASQLGPGFIATPEKPARTEEAPAVPLLSGTAPETDASTATGAKNAVPAVPAEPGKQADDGKMPVEAGIAAGLLAEAAAALPEGSAVKVQAPTASEGAKSAEPAAVVPMQLDKEADSALGDAPLSSSHVPSAPSKALDAAERGMSPVAAAGADASKTSFTETATPDAAAAEKAHNVLEDNVMAVDAAADSTADTLDAGLGAQGADAKSASAADEGASKAGALSHMTQPAGESAADAKVTEPAVESPQLLGVAGTGENEEVPHNKSPEDQGNPEGHPAQPAEGLASEAKVTEPATESPHLLGVATTGEDNKHNKVAETEPAPQAAASAGDDKAAEPAMKSPELLGMAVPGKEGPHPPKAYGEAASSEKASKTAGQTAQAETDAKLSGIEGAPKPTMAGSTTEEADAVSGLTQAAAETPGDAKAAEPAQGSIELLGAAKATDAASEPIAPASSSVAPAPAGESPKTAALPDTFTLASPRLDETVATAGSPTGSGGSADRGSATQHDAGADHGKKEHGSLFASARAFFKRKEADGKH